MQNTIHIVDAETEADSQQTTSEQAVRHVDRGGQTLYEEATPVRELSSFGRRAGQFVEAVADELGKEQLLEDVRLVDELDATETDDVDLAVLLALPDESLLFLGSDPTAKDTTPLFAFAVEPTEPVPAPTSAQEALDLLRPAAVRDAFDGGTEPARQGEWWLLPSLKVPAGTSFSPGVRTRPYGPSPLGNHVPREYGFTATDAEFVESVREIAPTIPSSVETPPEIVEWLNRQHAKAATPAAVPSWEAVQEVAGEVLVRGTLRHREDEHYVENIGEEWHVAKTHDMDVYTADDYLERVRID